MQPEFYVEGFTAEGVPYGPVHLLTTPIAEEDFQDEGAREAWEDAWREAVMRDKDKGEDIG